MDTSAPQEGCHSHLDLLPKRLILLDAQSDSQESGVNGMKAISTFLCHKTLNFYKLLTNHPPNAPTCHYLVLLILVCVLLRWTLKCFWDSWATPDTSTGTLRNQPHRTAASAVRTHRHCGRTRARAGTAPGVPSPPFVKDPEVSGLAQGYLCHFGFSR